MTDDQTAVITTKQVSDTRIKADHILVIGAKDGPGASAAARSRSVPTLVIGAKDGPGGFEGSVAAGVSAYNNPGVDEAFERAEREYDPAAYDDGTVVARIHPDGTTEWPLEDDQ